MDDILKYTDVLKHSDVKNVPFVRVYGSIIEEKEHHKILSFGKRIVSFKNDEDFSTVPEHLKEHSLHYKIRHSDLPQVKEFLEYEDQLESEEDLKKLQEENYEELEDKKNRYTELKKSAELAILRTARVIFCTCSEAGSARVRKSVGLAEQCIIDECGMCIEPETLLPMILSKKIILVGDHKQLQPVVLSKTAESLGLKISMFQQLFEDEKMSRYCIMLTEQYRMVINIYIN